MNRIFLDSMRGRRTSSVLSVEQLSTTMISSAGRVWDITEAIVGGSSAARLYVGMMMLNVGPPMKVTPLEDADHRGIRAGGSRHLVARSGGASVSARAAGHVEEAARRAAAARASGALTSRSRDPILPKMSGSDVVNITHIQDAVRAMLDERASLIGTTVQPAAAGAAAVIAPSSYWSDFCGQFEYMLDLPPKAFDKLRNHT